MIPRILLPALLWLFLAALPARAQLILYTFTGDSTASSVTPVNYTATSIVEGAGMATSLTAFSATTGDSPPTWILHTALNGSSGSTTLNDAITANDFVTFSITPDAGYALNLTQISLELRGSVQSGTHDPWTGLGITYDPEGDGTFTAPLTLNSTATLPSTGSLAARSAALTNLEVTNTVTFRIYFFGTGNANRGVVDNVRLNGTVSAVPEPSAAAALGLAGLALLAFRRRLV